MFKTLSYLEILHDFLNAPNCIIFLLSASLTVQVSAPYNIILVMFILQIHQCLSLDSSLCHHIAFNLLIPFHPSQILCLISSLYLPFSLATILCTCVSYRLSSFYYLSIVNYFVNLQYGTQVLCFLFLVQVTPTFTLFSYFFTVLFLFLLFVLTLLFLSIL